MRLRLIQESGRSQDLSCLASYVCNGVTISLLMTRVYKTVLTTTLVLSLRLQRIEAESFYFIFKS